MKRWTICESCETLIRPEDEDACKCVFRDWEPRHIEVVPVSEYNRLREGIEAEVERLRKLAADERWTAGETQDPGLGMRAHVRGAAYAFAADHLEVLLSTQQQDS